MEENKNMKGEYRMEDNKQEERITNTTQDYKKIEIKGAGKSKKIEAGVVEGYKKIETGVVEGYKKIENGVVQGFGKITDKFVDKFLTREGESVEDTKKRLADEQKAREIAAKEQAEQRNAKAVGSLQNETFKQSKQ